MINCEFEDGGNGELRHVTVDTIVLRDDKVLLGKRIEKFLEGGKWGLVGGFMARDEDIFQASKREVVEETGWKVDKLTLLRIKHWPNRQNEDRQNVSFVFFGTASQKIGEKDHETSELKWFPLDELPSKKEIAFDHGEDIALYKKYLEEKFNLPLV